MTATDVAPSPADEPGAPRRLGAAELARRLGQQHPPTAEQVLAVEAPTEPLVVVAGAGSGKTQTMAMRVVWLVANGLVEPHRVLGLTFTRKAAAELGARVRQMLRGLLGAHDVEPFLPPDVAAALRAGEPTVSTYHAYAATLLGEHALRIGVEPTSRLIGPAVAWQYAMEAVEGYDGDMGDVGYAVSTVVDSVLALAGDLAEHLREPDELRDLLGVTCEQIGGLPAGARGASKPVQEFLQRQRARGQLLPLVERFRTLKRERGVIDYGDQVALAARIARDCPDVAALERVRWGAVLLDEYQDTGEAQRVLLTSLFGSRKGDGGDAWCVTAVGDPRQSIYGWRGASAGNLERFADDFGGGRAAGLTISFRNGEQVLAVANAVAERIPVRRLAVESLRSAPGREDVGWVEAALVETVDDEAELVADRVAALADASPAVPWGEIAVLARKRSHFARIEAALRRRGVPCEVVGLGGLLTRPEVLDVVATLRVLADPSAGSALVRMLTGPRWRIGPRDLARLGARAALLARRRHGDDDAAAAAQGGSATSATTTSASRGVTPPAALASAESAAMAAASDAAVAYDAADDRSLVDALDDLGPPSAYSEQGHARLVALRDELRDLRPWTAQPLPDLVAAVVRITGLDVELAARPGTSYADALADLDRLVEVAEEFVAEADDARLTSFLAYLDAAEEREDGLEPDQPELGSERVQLMTVHAAKGLEWDVVVVAGAVAKVFPVEGQQVANWTTQIKTLPFDLRGDRPELPELGWRAADDQPGIRKALEDFADACKQRALTEEQRLAYVAVTRPRKHLLVTGYWWDHTVKPRGPSSLLELVGRVTTECGRPPRLWTTRPDDDAPNPFTAEGRAAAWPLDPLGSRRGDVEAGAALVDDVRSSALAQLPLFERTETPAQVQAWDEEISLLLAEREEQRRRHRSAVRDVELPPRLSVSQLVQLRRDPAALARELRRPVPQEPVVTRRRGTRFHLWLEQRWGQQRLLDLEELPGSADETAAPDADLVALQDAFRSGPFWHRTPLELEVPFDLRLGGLVLRGRIDAVFADDPAGVVDVVDWKTGAPPRPGDEREQAARAVQLAVYRLAWNGLTGTPLDRIRASFHYVRDGSTVHPVDLLDEAALVALLEALPTG